MEITMERSQTRHYSYIDAFCKVCGTAIRVKLGNVLHLCELCREEQEKKNGRKKRDTRRRITRRRGRAMGCASWGTRRGWTSSRKRTASR